MAGRQKSDNISWATEEFSKIRLEDKRLNQRCKRVAEALEQQSTEPINQACEDWADTKAAYRFFDNPKVTPDQILAPHYQRTVKRMKLHALVLAVQDTSFLNYTHHLQTEGVGEIGTKAQNQRGFGMHSTLAVTPQGLSLGLLTQQFFERPIGAASHTASETQKLPIEEKESYRWIEAFEQVIGLTPEDVQAVTVCDREADFYEMFVTAKEKQADLLVRANTDRRLGEETKYLWAKVESQRKAGDFTVDIVGNDKRKARQAIVSVRFCTVKLRPSGRPQKRSCHLSHSPLFGCQKMIHLLTSRNPLNGCCSPIQPSKTFVKLRKSLRGTVVAGRLRSFTKSSSPVAALKTAVYKPQCVFKTISL